MLVVSLFAAVETIAGIVVMIDRPCLFALFLDTTPEGPGATALMTSLYVLKV